jgi:wyosine [tRNA(Phe)-imidazoG37] synthetase (radical SAM superfamily)
MPLTNTRKAYSPPEDILVEVRQALDEHAAGEIDWVTFVGSGETCLYSSLGWLVREVKALTRLPVAVITNGSLLYLPEVREDLSAADAVLPSLDAGTPELYRRINRPHPQVTFERLVDGLAAFRDEYQGQLWVEVMLVRGLNDSEAALRAIAFVMERIKPDQVHLVLPTRPPVETWVQPPDDEGLLRAHAILGNTARVIHPASGSFNLCKTESLVDAIVEIITRHPMREDELVETLKNIFPGEVNETLTELEKSGKAQVVERYGVRFWSASPAYYPAIKTKAC